MAYPRVRPSSLGWVFSRMRRLASMPVKPFRSSWVHHEASVRLAGKRRARSRGGAETATVGTTLLLLAVVARRARFGADASGVTGSLSFGTSWLSIANSFMVSQ